MQPPPQEEDLRREGTLRGGLLTPAAAASSEPASAGFTTVQLQCAMKGRQQRRAKRRLRVRQQGQL